LSLSRNDFQPIDNVRESRCGWIRGDIKSAAEITPSHVTPSWRRKVQSVSVDRAGPGRQVVVARGGTGTSLRSGRGRDTGLLGHVATWSESL
jgi:hypothetical protein